MLKAPDQSIRIEGQFEQSFIQVKQVSVLLPLKQRAQLGSEKFLRLKGDDLRGGLMSAIVDLKWVALQAKDILVLAGV